MNNIERIFEAVCNILSVYVSFKVTDIFLEKKRKLPWMANIVYVLVWLINTVVAFGFRNAMGTTVSMVLLLWAAEGSIGFTSSPGQLVIEQEVSRDLWNRVNSRLSPMEKQVLQFYLDGNNYMQIAGLMKKSPKSVDNALQRIRQKIRQMNHLEERG